MLDYFEFSNSGEITDSNHIYDASSGFSTDVMEMSPDGQYFAVDTYGYLRKTDRDLTPVTSLDGGYSVDDYTFNSSGSSIYATSQYYNTMLEYHYPSGTVVKNYTLSGEPLHLFYKNGNCIIAENLYDYSSRTFIEIINVSGKGK